MAAKKFQFKYEVRNICMQISLNVSTLQKAGNTKQTWVLILKASAAGQFSSEIKQEQSWVWLTQEHKLCVTHVVTHCCPPALLTQLYTSVMGLGAKTAPRRPSPHQTIGGGPLLRVGGLGARIGLCNTANSDISEHWACSCVSVSKNATCLTGLPQNLDIAPRSRTS